MVVILPYDRSVNLYNLSSVSICMNFVEIQIIQLHVFFFLQGFVLHEWLNNTFEWFSSAPYVPILALSKGVEAG